MFSRSSLAGLAAYPLESPLRPPLLNKTKEQVHDEPAAYNDEKPLHAKIEGQDGGTPSDRPRSAVLDPPAITFREAL